MDSCRCSYMDYAVRWSKIRDASIRDLTQIRLPRAPRPLLERDQVGTTQGRFFLLEGLVRRVRAVLIQYLVKTDDFLIVVGPQARIHRDHDRVIAQCCSDRRVEYGPADLPSGENERRNAFSLESFVQVGIEKPVLRIGNKGYVARGGGAIPPPISNVLRSRTLSPSRARLSPSRP